LHLTFSPIIFWHLIDFDQQLDSVWYASIVTIIRSDKQMIEIYKKSGSTTNLYKPSV